MDVVKVNKEEDNDLTDLSFNVDKYYNTSGDIKKIVLSNFNPYNTKLSDNEYKKLFLLKKNK